MSESERLERIFEEAKEEIKTWPSWKMNQEPSPGQSYREWLLSEQNEPQE